MARIRSPKERHAGNMVLPQAGLTECYWAEHQNVNSLSSLGYRNANALPDGNTRTLAATRTSRFMTIVKKNSRLHIHILVSLVLTVFCSCGLAYEKHITDKYYIVSADSDTDLSLSYQLSSGDFVGKAPGQLLQYGFNDTFLIAVTNDYKKEQLGYYIIDMTKDSELAHEETFRVGPLTETEYNQNWRQKLNIQLKIVR